MNKTEFIAEVYARIKEDNPKFRINKLQAAACVNTVLDTIMDTVADGDNVKLIGFATFDTVDMPEKVARNPITGDSVKVPAHRKLKIKASSAFKNYVK